MGPLNFVRNSTLCAARSSSGRLRCSDRRGDSKSSCRMEWGFVEDELAGTCHVCAVAPDSLYRDRWDRDERDRGDSADDGVCGFWVGPARECGDGAAREAGREDL